MNNKRKRRDDREQKWNRHYAERRWAVTFKMGSSLEQAGPALIENRYFRNCFLETWQGNVCSSSDYKKKNKKTKNKACSSQICQLDGQKFIKKQINLPLKS